MAELFPQAGQSEQPGDVAAANGNQHVVGVAVCAGVWGTFDYLWHGGLGEPARGQRVRVPFGKGNRRTLGFVTDTLRRAGRAELKPVLEVVDGEPQLDETLWTLATWISHYYLAPLGQVLAAMVPAAVGQRPPRTELVAYLESEPKDWPATLGGRQKRMLDELLEARRQGVEPVELNLLIRQAGASRDSVHRLVRRTLMRTESREVKLPELTTDAGGDPFDLNDDQQAVLAEFGRRLEEKAFSVSLLLGVTGSGKTEVYIRAIRKAVDAGGQALLLVPEISLATQTLQRLLTRLPRVAVLHSGLSDTERAFYYQQIRDGQADVIVGPRSAAFAPARRLALIIIDEEHESGYKQDNTPRYHGRDVAIYRASLTGCPVLLGSATPSLESWHNAQTGRYRLLRLPRRVRGLPMPILKIVPLRQEMQPGHIELIGQTLTYHIAAALDRREQVILLMNRRGFASYVFCPSCGWILLCEHCDRPLVYHKAIQLGVCHHCQYTAAVPHECPVGGHKLTFFGYGIQRIESELSRKFSEAVVTRMDSDTMTTPKQFREVFDRFAAGETDILLGTQMVAKGLDFPKVSLVGVASGDTSLAIPDFRASERTFQLIVQVAGRAGRSDRPGTVVVQTLYPEEPSIRFATEHDYEGFAAWELPTRQQADLPPFVRMVRLIVRHRETLQAEQAATQLAARLRAMMPADTVKLAGPMPAGVVRVNDLFRFQILLTSPTPGLIQRVLYPALPGLSREIKGEILADADPSVLL